MPERWRGTYKNVGGGGIYWAVDTDAGREYFQFRWQAQDRIDELRGKGELVQVKQRKERKWVDERPT